MTKKTMFEMAFPNANTGNGVTFTEEKLGGEMKIYKRSVYEDQKYTISFGTEKDFKDWKQEEQDWIAQDFSVEDDSIEQIGVSTDKNIGALLNTINKIIRENK